MLPQGNRCTVTTFTDWHKEGITRELTAADPTMGLRFFDNACRGKWRWQEVVGSTIKEINDAPWGLAPGRFSFCSLRRGREGRSLTA